MHALITYALYRSASSATSDRDEDRQLEPEVRQVLEAKLDKALDPSIAVHAVFGHYLPQLKYLDSDWLEEHLGNIFPGGEERSHYWYVRMVCLRMPQPILPRSSTHWFDVNTNVLWRCSRLAAKLRVHSQTRTYNWDTT